MQPPSAADLLAIVGEVLDDEVVRALQGPAQHHARVAASLVAIVERELRLGDDVSEQERDGLTALLELRGTDADADADPTERRRRVADALRSGLGDAPSNETVVWETLMSMVRAQLTVTKPGHDDWSGD